MAILNTVLPSNITEYPNSFKRQGAFPLERYSVFYDIKDDNDDVTSTAKQEALNYAKTNPVAYVGQIVSVVDVVDNVASVDVYKIVQKYIEGKIVHDLERVGDAQAITAANAAITALAEKIEDAEDSIVTLQEIVNGKGEGEDRQKGLVEKLNDHITATTEYGSRLGELEANSATKDQVSTAKAEAIQTAVERVLGEGVNADFDTLKEVADWILSDTTGAANIITRLSNIEKDYLVAEDKTELQNNINTVDGKFTDVNDAITDLNTLIGTLPTGSTNVVAYINSAIDGLKIGDYAKVSQLEALSDEVQSVKTDVSQNKTDIADINKKLEGLPADKTILELLNDKLSVPTDGSRLINTEEAAILSKLSLNDGQVEIGGNVAAGNITGLPQKIADILADNTSGEGALLNSKVSSRHLDSSLIEAITGDINISRLEQTEGDWLILNGGNASGTFN